MSLRETARRIFLGALDQIQMTKVMARHVQCSAGVLRVGGIEYPLQRFGSIRIVSAGKAAKPMAEALITPLKLETTVYQTLSGIVIAPTTGTVEGLHYLVGGHPVPNEDSLIAGAKVLEYLAGSERDCLVFFLISGGASAMMEQPLDWTMTVEETASFHRVLVHSGLGIQKMNALRKHFSAVKGGRLAVATASATKLTLLVSDVPGDAAHVIGSGPTLPDPTTAADCRAILNEYSDTLPFPVKVRNFFSSVSLPETPKASNPAFQNASSFTLVSSETLCMEAARLAKQEGFHVEVDNACDEWPFDKAAQYLLDRLAKLHAAYGRVCLLSAGEISVKVEGHTSGVGGRNQHFVLECARRIEGSDRPVTVLSAGTDGIDGNSFAAGGICDERTVARASAAGLNIDAALNAFDSSSLLQELGDTLVTGPSGNNVRDLRVLLTM